MKYDWTKYKTKILELREIFKNKNEGMDVEVAVITPEDPDFNSEVQIPYVRIRFYIENHVYERKVELFEHYMQKDVDEIVKLIEFFIQEFESEIESSEYGGG